MNHVTIRFFAQLKDRAGADTLSLDIVSEYTLKQLVSHLEETIPNLKGVLSTGNMQTAINQEFVDDETVIKHGDEVAFLPPFSGG
ncbi:MAG: molybdopterin converting factor subunit 1 [Nitrospirota bacterium]